MEWVNFSVRIGHWEQYDVSCQTFLRKLRPSVCRTAYFCPGMASVVVQGVVYHRLLSRVASKFLVEIGVLRRFFPQTFGILLHFNLWSFSLYVSFSKRTFQIFGGFMIPLHSPKEWPQYNGFPKICHFRDLRFLGKSSKNEDFFPRANLILLPAWVVSISRDYCCHFDITWKSSSEFELRGDFGQWRDFSSSRFGPATGAMLANTFCCVSKLTAEWRFERRPMACLASPGSLQNSLLLLFR